MNWVKLVGVHDSSIGRGSMGETLRELLSPALPLLIDDKHALMKDLEASSHAQSAFRTQTLGDQAA